MELRVLDTNFVALDILDGIDSALWSERYSRAGEFEIYTEFTPYYMNLLQIDRYLSNSLSEKLMIIEDVKITTDPERGDKLIVTGRSLESILERRIILRQIIIDSSVHDGIKAIIDKEIINGIFPDRNIPNFIFEVSTDPLVTTATMETQFYMENVYEAIVNICEAFGLGFKITRNSSGQFVFKVYAGVDRSYAQSSLPTIIFSPDLDNLVRSDYYRSKRFRKTYIFVSGQDGLESWNQGNYGKWGHNWSPDYQAGLDRREMFLSAEGLLKSDADGLEVPDSEYFAQLSRRGADELTNHVEFEVFNGEVDMSRLYNYREHFFLGDIIHMKDHYGHSGEARVDEIIMSDNLSGSYIHPVLKSV